MIFHYSLISRATEICKPMASPIVIDNGSGVMKAGFAGADLPESVFQTYVGRAKYDRVMAAAADDEIYIGKRAEEMRGVLRLAWSFPTVPRSVPVFVLL